MKRTNQPEPERERRDTLIPIYRDTAERVRASADKLGMKIYARTSQLVANGFKLEDTQKAIERDLEANRAKLRAGHKLPRNSK